MSRVNRCCCRPGVTAWSGEGLTQTKGHVCPWFHQGRQALRENLLPALLIEAKELETTLAQNVNKVGLAKRSR